VCPIVFVLMERTVGMFIYTILTYLLHAAEAFFEKLTDFQLVKNFSAFYGT